MNYIANEVIKNFEMLKAEVERFEPVTPLADPAREGIRVSRTVCKQEGFVHPTPIMKNALVIFGDVRQYQENGEWHTEKFKATGKLGKAAEKLLEILKAAMLQEFGRETHDYPEDIPFTDPIYYEVDCWNFYDELSKKFWDIVPGQEDEVREVLHEYESPKTNLSLDDMSKLLKTSPELAKAIEIENRIWPMTKASRDILSISDPFMSKKTGVSYPDFHNDAALVEGTDETYGEYEIRLAKEALDKGFSKLLKFGYDNAVYTAYTRRQLGKGRALIAMSRRTNLVVNMVNGVEMEELKETKALQIPFLNEDDFLREFSKIGELLLANQLVGVNIDASKWDKNLGEGLVVLQDAERYTLAQGEMTKQLVKLRTLCNVKAYLLNGPSNKQAKIFGRMMSGYDDTTSGNTKANRTSATCSAIKTSRKYVNNVISKMRGYHIVAVGDDLFIVLEKYSDAKEFIKHETDDFNLVIHGDEKFAKGLFFIQWRIFKLDGKWIMAYNIPRVFRSMLSKEDAKHLGRGGWTLAYYQQLGKVMRYPKALKIVVNILAAFDQYHLSLNTDISEILKMVKEEDKLVSANSKGKTVQSTAERMYRSNPNISGLKVDKNGKVQLDGAYFRRIQKKLREVYNPNYLTELGFAIPDLSKVH